MDLISLDASTAQYEVSIQLDLYAKELHGKKAIDAGQDGIHSTIVGNISTFIGTDGKRLAKVDTPIELDLSFQGSYIIPLKAIEEMIKMLDENNSNATLSLMPDKVFLESSNLILITKQIQKQKQTYAQREVEKKAEELRKEQENDKSRKTTSVKRSERSYQKVYERGIVIS